MIVPRFIRPGDTIGVTAPSYGLTDPADIRRLENAESKLGAMGYRVRETPDVRTADEDRRSAPAEQRVEELLSLISDPDVPYILSAAGGDYQIEMLQLMDWEVLERNQTWLQGYSDNTVLLFKATAEHDVASIYASNFCDYGMEPWHRCVEDNLAFVEGRSMDQRSFSFHESGFHDRSAGTEPVHDDEPVRWIHEGDVDMRGRLIGGCSEVLDWFLRSGSADPSGFVDRYARDGIIWYMETYESDDGRMERMLGDMAKAGWFEGCTGFVFGRPLFYEGKRRYNDVVTESLR